MLFTDRPLNYERPQNFSYRDESCLRGALPKEVNYDEWFVIASEAK